VSNVLLIIKEILFKIGIINKFEYIYNLLLIFLKVCLVWSYSGEHKYYCVSINTIKDKISERICQNTVKNLKFMTSYHIGSDRTINSTRSKMFGRNTSLLMSISVIEDIIQSYRIKLNARVNIKSSDLANINQFRILR